MTKEAKLILMRSFVNELNKVATAAQPTLKPQAPGRKWPTTKPTPGFGAYGGPRPKCPGFRRDRTPGGGVYGGTSENRPTPAVIKINKDGQKTDYHGNVLDTRPMPAVIKINEHGQKTDYRGNVLPDHATPLKKTGGVSGLSKAVKGLVRAVKGGRRYSDDVAKSGIADDMARKLNFIDPQKSAIDDILHGQKITPEQIAAHNKAVAASGKFPNLHIKGSGIKPSAKPSKLPDDYYPGGGWYDEARRWGDIESLPKNFIGHPQKRLIDVLSGGY